MSEIERSRVSLTVQVVSRAGVASDDSAGLTDAPFSWTSTEAAVPALHDRYDLGGRLGKGGMGEVFLARDGLLNREVAVKILSQDVIDRPALLRFLREAQVTAQLTHPNVVPIFSLEEGRTGAPALAMKLIKGSHSMSTSRSA